MLHTTAIVLAVAMLAAASPAPAPMPTATAPPMPFRNQARSLGPRPPVILAKRQTLSDAIGSEFMLAICNSVNGVPQDVVAQEVPAEGEGEVAAAEGGSGERRKRQYSGYASVPQVQNLAGLSEASSQTEVVPVVESQNDMVSVTEIPQQVITLNSILGEAVLSFLCNSASVDINSGGESCASSSSTSSRASSTSSSSSSRASSSTSSSASSSTSRASSTTSSSSSSSTSRSASAASATTSSSRSNGAITTIVSSRMLGSLLIGAFVFSLL